MVRTVFGEIMLCEFFSHFGRCNTYNRVLARIIVVRKLEQVRSDGAFLERAARPTDCALNDVREELAAPFTSTKCIALQQVIEFRPDGPLA